MNGGALRATAPAQRRKSISIFEEDMVAAEINMGKGNQSFNRITSANWHNQVKEKEAQTSLLLF